MYDRIRYAVNVMPLFWPFQYPIPDAYFRPQLLVDIPQTTAATRCEMLDGKTCSLV